MQQNRWLNVAPCWPPKQGKALLDKTAGDEKTDQQDQDRTLCPVCKTGHLVHVEIIQPTARLLAALSKRQTSP